MLKKMWLGSSFLLLVIGGVEAWISSFDYLPVCWLLTGLISALALVLTAYKELVGAIRRCFAPVPNADFEKYFGSKSCTTKTQGRNKQTKSCSSDPLNPNNSDSECDGDPFIDPTHPMYHIYDDFR